MTDRYRVLDKDRFDAIVVGAGTGGLVAAALLATRGLEVLVLDSHYVAGGNGTVFRRRGYEFDVGVHYVGGCHAQGQIPRILRAAGAHVDFEEMDPNGYDTIVLPDMQVRFPKGIDAFRDRLLSAFPAERAGIERYAGLLRQLGRLQGLAANPMSALWRLPRSLGVLRYGRRTFAELLDDVTRDPRLRAVLAAQSGDYALPPSRAAALVGLGLTHHYLDGAYFPKGGGQVISDRLAESVERSGGKIVLRARVEKILVEGGRVAGVELVSKHLGRRRVRADVVISNADLKRTFLELVGPEHVSAATVRRVTRYEMSPAIGSVYLGIDRDLVAERHRRTNYWIFTSLDQEKQYREVISGAMPEEPFAFVSIASVKDPTNPRYAPEGVTNLQVMGLAPSKPGSWGVSEAQVADGSYSRSAEYRARKEAYASRLIETASRVFPDLRERIVYQEVATPLTLRRFTGATGGTSYGIALTPDQLLERRPGTRTEVEGLYLCGASTRSGHGIGGVTLSGLYAAAAVLGRPLVRDVLTGRAPAPDGAQESATGGLAPYPFVG